ATRYSRAAQALATMKRRPTSRGKAAKSRQPKAAGPKGVAGQGTVVARLTHERDDALLREAANSEILRLISRSGDLTTAFRTILENASRICNANCGRMVLVEGKSSRIVADAHTPAKLAEHFKRLGPFEPTTGSHLDRVRRKKQVSYTADDTAEPVQGIAAK